MKKIFLTLLLIVATMTMFSQTFIGANKKEILNDIKKDALKTEESKKESDGSYSLSVKFDGYGGIYTFTKEDICCFIVMYDTYNYTDYSSFVKNLDNKYLRAFELVDKYGNLIDKNGKKSDVWKEYKGGYFVYHWIVINLNTNIYYYICLTQLDYETNRDSYLSKILGSR